MFEIRITTSDRGTIQRSAESYDNAESIRAGWVGFSTTLSVTVTRDGEEIEEMAYNKG